MRILSILASPAPGGAETLVRNLGSELVQRGHEFHVLFMSDARGVGNPPAFERGYLAQLEGAGIGFDFMSPKAFRSALRAGWEFRRLAAAVRPDLVHAHLGRGVLCRSLSGAGLPTIYTHHTVQATFPTALFKLFNRTVDHYVAVGSACRAFLERHARRPIATIPNGVPSDFGPGGTRGGVSPSPMVLAVGGLRVEKGYATFIEAAALVAERAPDHLRSVRFAIAGDGPERPRLEQLIRDRGLGSRFELLGARGDIGALMQDADLLVNSSVFEGLPVTLVEAIASGLPIVASDVGGNPEVVSDGVNGFLVPPSQPELLAARIIDALASAEQYVAFATAALTRAKQFSMPACVDAHVDVYRKVLER